MALTLLAFVVAAAASAGIAGMIARTIERVKLGGANFTEHQAKKRKTALQISFGVFLVAFLTSAQQELWASSMIAIGVACGAYAVIYVITC